MITFLFISLGVFLIMGIPIAFGLCMSVTLSFLLFSDMPIVIIVQRLFANLTHYTLIAVPFFVLAGVIMENAGIARRLIKLANQADQAAKGQSSADPWQLAADIVLGIALSGRKAA